MKGHDCLVIGSAPRLGFADGSWCSNARAFGHTECSTGLRTGQGCHHHLGAVWLRLQAGGVERKDGDSQCAIWTSAQGRVCW